MALLFNYSANNINTAALPGAYAGFNGAPTVGIADGPQGINTIHCNGQHNYVALPNVGVAINGNGLIVGGGFNITGSYLSATGIYCIGGNGNDPSLLLQVSADGSIQIFIPGGTVYSSPSGTLTFGNRHEIEITVSAFSTSGTVSVDLDGVAVTGLTAIAVANLASLNDGGTIHTVLVGGGQLGSWSATPIIVDSTYAMDTTGSFCNAAVGPAISVPMIPNAPGQESAWTPSGAALGWECISEIPPDGDTTYISSDTPTQEEACALSAPVGISGVYGVSVISDQRQDTSGGGRTIELGLGNGTTRSYGSAWGLGTTYAMNTTPFSENPFTSSAWTLGAMTGLQVAAQLAS